MRRRRRRGPTRHAGTETPTEAMPTDDPSSGSPDPDLAEHAEEPPPLPAGETARRAQVAASAHFDEGFDLLRGAVEQVKQHQPRRVEAAEGAPAARRTKTNGNGNGNGARRRNGNGNGNGRTRVLPDFDDLPAEIT